MQQAIAGARTGTTAASINGRHPCRPPAERRPRPIPPATGQSLHAGNDRNAADRPAIWTSSSSSFSEQLNQRNTEDGTSLRDSGQRAETQEEFVQQREQLSNLLERMQQTVEEAEQPEPLLARQLYDTMREANQQRIDDALDVTQRLLEVGIEREASESMQTADQGVRATAPGRGAAPPRACWATKPMHSARRSANVNRLAEELNREIQQALRDASAGPTTCRTRPTRLTARQRPAAARRGNRGHGNRGNQQPA